MNFPDAIRRSLSMSVIVCSVMALCACKHSTEADGDQPLQYDYSYVNHYRTDFDASKFTVIKENQYSRLCMMPNALTDTQVKTLSANIDTVISRICAYLNTNVEKEYNGFKGKVTYFVEPGIIPRCYGGSPIPIVSMSTDNSLSSLYAHETVHIFSMKTSSTYLIEGLAVHLADTLRVERLWPNYSESLHDHAKGFLDTPSSQAALTYIGTSGFYSVDPTTSTGEAFYTLSGSFVRYLMQTIGRASFMAVYSSADFKSSLYAATHKSFDEWEAEWLNYLRIGR
jgi:hypothetical protein